MEITKSRVDGWIQIDGQGRITKGIGKPPPPTGDDGYTVTTEAGEVYMEGPPVTLADLLADPTIPMRVRG